MKTHKHFIILESPRGSIVHSAGVTSGMDSKTGMVTSLMMNLVFAHGIKF